MATHGADGADDAQNTTLSALLLLADGRFPSGGHAHSGGFEATAFMEGIADVDSMEHFLIGRLHTVGVVAAAFAAAACDAFRQAETQHPPFGAAAPARLDELNSELDARTPSPALRSASRRLGRQVLRAGRRIWPHPGLDTLASQGAGAHQPVAFGAVAGAAGLDAMAAALASANDAVIGPATAAVRLLALDPFAVHAVLARLAPQIDAIAAQGARHATTAPTDLPALSAPMLDIAGESHQTWEVRLFAS